MNIDDVKTEDVEDNQTLFTFSTATQNEFFQHWWNNEGLDLFIKYYNTE
jgi:hypothetical protein